MQDEVGFKHVIGIGECFMEMINLGYGRSEKEKRYMIFGDGRKFVFALLVIVIGGGGMGACGPGPVEAGELRSDLERETLPVIEAGDLDALVSGNTAFALDLYAALVDDYDNLFYSPYSISLALAMTYAGARGETEQEMAQTLHFDLSQAQLHPAFNALDQELANRGELIELPDGEQEGFQLNIANSIWGQVDYAFLGEFLDLLALNYGAGMRVVDFVEDSELARQQINDWVSDETEERIQDLIPEGVLDAATTLVLTNAIYFNAAWMDPFDEAATKDGLFFLLDGGQVDVPMMNQSEWMHYAEGNGYQLVERSYVGGKMAMDIILPDTGAFSTIEADLDTEWLDQALSGLEGQQVALSMPRFEFESEVGLTETLQTMGMPTAFGGGADFSGMDGTRNLFIGEVLHKAFVSVDEAGTEAAAATAVIMERGMAPQSPIVISVDRPFIFLIRDLQTGAVLFVGRVLNPAL
jgi:serpin B